MTLTPLSEGQPRADEVGIVGTIRAAEMLHLVNQFVYQVNYHAAMALQDLANRMALTTTRLARLLRQQDQGELTLTFRAALATIERRGALTLGELAHAEHFAPPTVTKVVNKLAEQGLVERTTDPTDKRVCRVSVTPAGAELLAADRRRRAAWLAGRLSQLTPEERGRLAEALDVIESLTETELQRA